MPSPRWNRRFPLKSGTYLARVTGTKAPIWTIQVKLLGLRTPGKLSCARPAWLVEVAREDGQSTTVWVPIGSRSPNLVFAPKEAA